MSSSTSDLIDKRDEQLSERRVLASYVTQAEIPDLPLKAQGHHILVVRDEGSEISASLHIPGNKKAKPLWGSVFDVGPLVEDLPLTKGDHIYYHEYAVVEVNYQGETLIAIKDTDVICSETKSE